MSEHAKALHVLDRLAFGPWPGEVEAVEAMGIDRWIDLQLHPERIDDSALAGRLTDYQAPFMSPQTLMLKFPPGNLIRQALKGRIAVPEGEPQQAVWESQIALLRQRQQLQLQEQMQSSQQNGHGNMSQAQNMQTAAPAGAMNSDMETSSPAASEQNPHADLNVSSLIRLPAQRRYELLLNMQPGHIREIVRSLTPQDRPEMVADMTPAQRETVVALLSPRMVVVNETESVRLLEDIYSERQLERVMTEFWLNHFNISTNKNEVEPYYLPQFEHDVIAPHALGNFEDLLDAVAESPAMLLYLDNEQSIGPDSLFALRHEHPKDTRLQLIQMMRSAQPDAAQTSVPSQFHNRPQSGINENYGRELMELHTVGVNGGYTQQDVIEAARALTGWTVAPPRQGGGFRFDENRHEPGVKIVMGHKINAGGEKDGLELLHILATSPSTAHFISRELAVRFVSDHPSQRLVNRMAKTFLATHGNIGMVLKTMIHSPEFWSASNNGNKIKTPLDYVVSAVRATDADVTQPYRLVSELKVMGMPLTGTQEPNGYSMMNDAWASSSELVERMNFALALASNRIPGVTVSIHQLLGQHNTALTPVQQEFRLEQVILQGPASRQMHQAVMASLHDTAMQNRAAATLVLVGDGGANPFVAGMKRPDTQPANTQQAVMAGLMIGSPEFQRR